MFLVLYSSLFYESMYYCTSYSLLCRRTRYFQVGTVCIRVQVGKYTVSGFILKCRKTGERKYRKRQRDTEREKGDRWDAFFVKWREEKKEEYEREKLEKDWRTDLMMRFKSYIITVVMNGNKNVTNNRKIILTNNDSNNETKKCEQF